jgi:dGTP triphosphohydrolase
MPMFSTVRVRDCVKSLTISEVSAGPERHSRVINLSPKYQNFIASLKQMNALFLFRHPEIQANDNQGAFILRTLFQIFLSHYVERQRDTLFKHDIIPEDWHSRLQEADEPTKFRIICDYLSGMTDDYATMNFNRAIEVAL